MNNVEYRRAQSALAELKGAIYSLLENRPNGLKNVEIGKALGIYTGHVRHEGHIPRTLLAIMESEGVVEQNEKDKLWTLRALSEES